MDSALHCKEVISGSVAPVASEPEHVNQVCADLKNNWRLRSSKQLSQTPVRNDGGDIHPLSAKVSTSIAALWISDVAWAKIWQSLQLELAPKTLPQQVRLLRSWLRRSGTLPLSISITHKAIETVPTVSCAPEIIEELILHCSRWQYMEIEIPFDDLKLIQGAMPCLRHLDNWTYSRSRVTAFPSSATVWVVPAAPTYCSVPILSAKHSPTMLGEGDTREGTLSLPGGNPWASIAELVVRSCCIITDLFITESADWWNHLNSLQLASQNSKSIQWCAK
ncbi:hypothetical protein B0H13DRAFT_1907022 [Mycena leptocephala]|nr:hypothetical protein B0H13DRAFT_1907022 [Mycena leptocephala]